MAKLRAVIAETGSQRKAAKALGISGPYVNDLLRGRRNPGPALLRRMGLEKVTRVVTEYAESEPAA